MGEFMDVGKSSEAVRVSRRLALGAALVGAAAAAGAQAADRRAEAEAALRAFLHAFENDDLATMEAAFAPDAACFDPVVASSKGSGPLDLETFRRKPGMPPTMRALVQSSLKTGTGPPYRRLDPKDLLVQTEGEMALCTFHLEGPTSLARRTIVLVRRSGAWKILHIHASNVVTA
jgi:ketosteroid isomerase-like protein